VRLVAEAEETSMTLFHWIAVFGAAFVAGMINSVAGGGTLLTFPSLVWLGPISHRRERYKHCRLSGQGRWAACGGIAVS
jgi:hypothetical protein